MYDHHNPGFLNISFIRVFLHIVAFIFYFFAFFCLTLLFF